MHELLRVTEPPRECSYLPYETASLEVRAIAGLEAYEYGELLSRGYRRFGWQFFRPACPSCAKCRSLRIVVPEFTLSASERRIMKKNAGIRAELHPLFISREHVEIYNAYQSFMHEHRGWPLLQATARSLRQDFLTGAGDLGRQWLYFEEDRLMGVALMDTAPGAISMVYFFYRPEWRDRSPGTYSILNQILYAQAKGLPHAYLGYWVEACRSLSYKSRFGPYEILREYPPDGSSPVWE
jgi:arginine-tRNA-protein transferase